MALLGRDDPFNIGDISSRRFFTEHMYALFQTGDGDVRGDIIGHANE